MSAGFTPGPWVAESLHNADALGKAQWRITAKGRERVYRVADVYSDLPEDWDRKSPDAALDECAADARLIALAPHMRDALFRICDAESLREARDIADEALAALGGDE